MHRLLLVICFLFLNLIAFGQVDHWESVVLPEDSWQYLVPDEQPDVSWTSLSFDDSNWSTGNSGIGYGDGDDATLIDATLSLYMRYEFEIVTVDEIESLLLDMDFDDGFVAYLNGTEIARAFVSGDVPAFDQGANDFHEAKLYTGQVPDRFEVDHELLVNGTNVLAVEVHNENINSSDLTALPVLSVGLNTSSSAYRDVPSWFSAPFLSTEFTSSNLPIVIIETENGQSIPDEPKIWAQMSIIDNGAGERNFLTDIDNSESLDFSGLIGIEIRGSSSQLLDKKQYALTTFEDRQDKDNVSLLGLPEENDWILNGLAFDQSLMRDYLSYQMALKTGQYASRGIYCEMVLNGDYRGIYILQEKLKADDDRIDINKIGAFDNSDDLITGGYITKADKTEGNDFAAWTMPSNTGATVAFIHEVPKDDEVTNAQDGYIEGVFLDLADESRNNNLSLEDGYPSIIDIPSFIDFMIINELASNVDGYQFSTFFHKDRNAKLRAGPVWDFNLTYGNDLFQFGLDRSHEDVWQFDNGDNEGAMFWKDLFESEPFRCHMASRWHELTTEGQPLHPESIFQFMDEVILLLEEARPREQARWNTLGNYEAHIDIMKEWITDRIQWITTNLGAPRACLGEDVPSLIISKINYNPGSQGGFDEKDLEFVAVTNIGNATVDLTGVYFGGTDLVYQFDPNTFLNAGSTVYLANESLAFRSVYGFTPYDEFNRSLDNESETLLLLNGFGNVIDEVTYYNTAPWPEAANGLGEFMEVIDPNADNNDPSNWQIGEFGEILNLENNPEPRLSIYPNPAIERVMISAPSRIKVINLRDLSGKLIERFEVNRAEFELPLKRSYKGLYLVEIETVTKHYLRKLAIGE
ncbi:MAG: CotH kinase family protein [Cytophagales bacterium]|nr:CotH kinase family protein [Cytophagales bacterium]